MRTNTSAKRDPIYTHEGARAAHITPVQQLRRSVLSSLLWEEGFYESGVAIADRIRQEAQEVPVAVLAALAIEARSKFHLRHVPLYLTALLAQRGRGSSIVSETIRDVIQRADELAEFLAVYAKVNGVPVSQLKPKLSNQVRKGLAMAFGKFGEFHLSRYANRAGAVSMRDALFLCHAKPKDAEQKEVWEKLIAGALEPADTWEVALSAGKDKRETFERLIREERIGYMALLRNLKNCLQAGVDDQLVRDAILARRGADRVLPFRYVAAARAAPVFERELDQALCATINEMPALDGRNVVVVDVSGSMDVTLSVKSDMTRMDAGATLASMINAENLRVFTFSDRFVEVPPRRGMAGVDAIRGSQQHGGTYLSTALMRLKQSVEYDRLIVITDEQEGLSDETMPNPGCERAYLINVTSNRNGIGYGRWTHLDGMSEHVLRWIMEYEGGDPV
jgi:60 kDa SS-A/Ro ribonucleoprotein